MWSCGVKIRICSSASLQKEIFSPVNKHFSISGYIYCSPSSRAARSPSRRILLTERPDFPGSSIEGLRDDYWYVLSLLWLKPWAPTASSTDAKKSSSWIRFGSEQKTPSTRKVTAQHQENSFLSRRLKVSMPQLVSLRSCQGVLKTLLLQKQIRISKARLVWGIEWYRAAESRWQKKQMLLMRLSLLKDGLIQDILTNKSSVGGSPKSLEIPRFDSACSSESRSSWKQA